MRSSNRGITPSTLLDPNSGIGWLPQYDRKVAATFDLNRQWFALLLEYGHKPEQIRTVFSLLPPTRLLLLVVIYSVFGLALRTFGRCNVQTSRFRTFYSVSFEPWLHVLECAPNSLQVLFPIIAQKVRATLLYVNRFDPRADLKFYSDNVGFLRVLRYSY